MAEMPKPKRGERRPYRRVTTYAKTIQTPIDTETCDTICGLADAQGPRLPKLPGGLL